MGSRYWSDHTSKALAGMERARLVAVLPVAAIEQHGPHLPLSVDTDIVNGIVARTASLLPAHSQVLFLPTLAIGKSNEHLRYPGTLTLSAETLMRLWHEVGDSVAAAGVRKLVLFNSHGGQSAAMDLVARDLRVRHGMLVVASNWYMLGLPEGLFSAAELRHGIHAGEIETSLMLALRPQLVNMEEARDFASAVATREADFPTLGVVTPNRIGWQTQDLNPQGACGNAARATAETGRRVLEHVAARFVEVLDEVERFPLESLNQPPAW
ncbi:MAG: creatininase family protein [Burkholderiales bacterium]